jgi:hypothetical protein
MLASSIVNVAVEPIARALHASLSSHPARAATRPEPSPLSPHQTH